MQQLLPWQQLNSHRLAFNLSNYVSAVFDFSVEQWNVKLKRDKGQKGLLLITLF